MDAQSRRLGCDRCIRSPWLVIELAIPQGRWWCRDWLRSERSYPNRQQSDVSFAGFSAVGELVKATLARYLGTVFGSAYRWPGRLQAFRAVSFICISSGLRIRRLRSALGSRVIRQTEPPLSSIVASLVALGRRHYSGFRYPRCWCFLHQ